MKVFLTKNRWGVGVWATLIVILVLGAFFRFQALDWDQSQFFHPDERAIVSSVLNMNEVPNTGAANSPTHSVDFPPGGLSFFIPNKDSNLRPATQAETDQYFQEKSQNQPLTMPANVVLPDQVVPDDAVNFWNASFSPLNPHFFAYGSLPMYLMKLGGQIATVITGQTWSDWEHITLVGRFLSGVWSMGTLLLTFFLGRLLFRPFFGRKRSDIVGLLSAAFMAFTVLDIQLAHFATSDVTLTFFTTLAVYMSVRLSRSGRWTTAVGTGAAVGLALSSKISSAPAVLAAIVAALLYGLYGPQAIAGERVGIPGMKAITPREIEKYGKTRTILGYRLVTNTVRNFVIMGVVALVVWFIAMPYTFIDFMSWSGRVIEEAGISRGDDSVPYTRQYVGSIPFIYQAQNFVVWAVSIPLGVLALAGWAYSLWKAVWQRQRGELVLQSFLVPYSLITFSASSKFDRYMLPVIPLLIILAARLLVALASKHSLTVVTTQGSRFGRWTRSVVVNRRAAVWSFIGFFTLVWTLVWALSFSHIYDSEHTMNQATRWMYANIPNNATISHESWDEAIPSRIVDDSISNHSWCDPDAAAQGNGCNPIEYDIYGDDANPQKIDYFVGQIKKTDYYIINSNRLYATMPKLPWRYPVQIRFYQLLFNGDLGFQKVAEFTDYPTIPLLNAGVNDDSADESFTVYDHPKVMIFKKTAPLTDDEVRGLFSPVLSATQIVTRNPQPSDLPVKDMEQADGVLDSTTAGQFRAVDCGDAIVPVITTCPNSKSLLLDKPVDQLPPINDMSWNKLANDNQWLAVILWFVLIQLLGVIALPVAWRIFARLPDRGYILAKPLGAVIVALVIWLMVWTRIVMNTAQTAWVAVLITALITGRLWWMNRTAIKEWVVAHRRLIIIEESIFLVVYLAWIAFRIGNPDLWHPYFGGEKPMEMTHMLGILRSAYFPPYDPWFSDGFINYYYYGQYLVSTWIKLTGISPFIAFNLAIPIIYAFTCTGAFSLIFNLTSKYRQHRARFNPAINTQGILGPSLMGLLGIIIFAVGGNMDGLLQFLQRNQPFVDLANNLHFYPDPIKTLDTFDYFRSSRIVPGTINEFPAFSFIYSDLHAHLLDLPFTILIMVLTLNLLSTDWAGYVETGQNRWSGLWRMTGGRLWQVLDRNWFTPIVLMVVLGYMSATNSWDLPTYLLMVGAGVFLALFRRYFQPIEVVETPVFTPAEVEYAMAQAEQPTQVGPEIAEQPITQAKVQTEVQTEAEIQPEAEAPIETVPVAQVEVPVVSAVSPDEEVEETGEATTPASTEPAEDEEEEEALPTEVPVPVLVTSFPRFTAGSVLTDLVLTGLIMGITFGGGLALYWNFFSHFQAFFSQIALVRDQLQSNSYQSVSLISGRTEFKYFAVIFLLPLFVLLSYLFWNGFDWLRSRSLTPDNGWTPNGAEEDEDWDEEELSEDAQAVQPSSVPSVGLRVRQPQLALLTAGADGGSSFGGFGSGGFGDGTAGPIQPRFNRFARVWLLALVGIVVLLLAIGIITPNNWLVFTFSLAIMLSCLVLIFGRAFDRKHPEQSAEAVDPSSIFLKVMLLAGFGVTAATEVVYLKDDLAGSDGDAEFARMNTIFKFQYQVWALLTLAAAFAIYVIWLRWIAGRGPLLHLPTFAQLRRYGWSAIIALMIVAVLLYPIQAIPARLIERGSDPIPPPTLDGRAYFKTLTSVGGLEGVAPFDLTYDAQSVFEFYDKVVGTPVILQASIEPYRGGGSFIPINTGLPTVLGWDHHERQQRYPVMASDRSDSNGSDGLIRKIYNTSDMQGALTLLDHYHVTYIHLGVIERQMQYVDATGATIPYMSDEGFSKFDTMVKLGLLSIVYQNPGVTIFQITPKGMSGVISGDLSSLPPGTVVTDPKLTRLQTAVQTNPNDPQAHYDLGQYYFTKKDYPNAEAELQKVIAMTPNEVNPYHVLGDIYRDSGDENQALAEYLKATQVQAPSSEVSPAFNKYGVELQAVGQYAPALQQFAQAVQHDPHFNEAFYHEGEVYQIQGQKDQAIQAFQLAISTSQTKNDFWTQQATQKIRELSGG